MTCAVLSDQKTTDPTLIDLKGGEVVTSGLLVNTEGLPSLDGSTPARGEQPPVLAWWERGRAAVWNERGMATLEYALVCVAAAAFAGLLYVIVSGGEVENALKGIIEDAVHSKK